MNKQDFRSRDARLGFLLVLPAVILVILVVILPIISGIQISFTSQRVVGSEFEFIGPKNYFELFTDPLGIFQAPGINSIPKIRSGFVGFGILIFVSLLKPKRL